MPIEYHILKEKKLVIAKGSGVVTGTDIFEHLNSLAEDDRYSAPMKKLVDYRFIDSIEVTPNEASVIARKKILQESRFLDERCAFVAPDNLSYGTSRVHQALVESTDVEAEVFRKIEDALAWLDITLDADLIID